MLIGEKVALRARAESDVAVLHEELYEDVVMRSRADSRPWQPVSVESGQSPFRVREPMADAAVFSVVERAGGELAGEALLWGIQTHSRAAHIGISLRPSFRGRGLGADVVRLLCRYAFEVRGLNRVQVETLSDNAAMIATARRAGFTVEGTIREAGWVLGRFADEVVLGLLAREWKG
ncbi:GNAT family N-acetyltransferase [Streptomyces sp. TLI_171]|uniref:GNAT family N-acetyltransferase n=1 Tax=Streptomyces sp. TLI_171 TaxID=1938859 RepID=UPI000C1912C4|nr:GNAT family protein [Streptomyces sp. TLI_171]RKE22854.1 RimJ/RimL family protein N-acetyltransferase [Streptomyces sp. TLI_171]